MKKLLLFSVVVTFCAFFVACSRKEKPEDDPNNPLWKIIPDTVWYKKNQSADSFTITTAEELAGLAVLVEDSYSMLGKTIKLGANISFVPKSRSAQAPKHLWQAIGSYQKPFKGTFDGDGFVISGIYLYTTGEHQGFFGWIDEAIVKNLGLSGLYVDAHSKVGGLVGCSRLSGIYNCYTSGEIKGASQWVGGLVGYNDGGWIENSYSKCKVSGEDFVGGLVGCSVGEQFAKITNSYSTGAVSVKKSIVGGFAGQNTAGSKIKDCYYDKETSNQADTSKGDARTTSQMKQRGNYVNWDFADVWKIDNSKNGGYPYLQIGEK